VRTPLRICFLVEGSPRRGLSPAARFRVIQYLPYLRQAGIVPVVRPSRPSKYFEHGRGMRRVYDWCGSRVAGAVARIGLKLQVASRLHDLAMAGDADVVVLQRDLQASDQSRLDELLLYFNDKIVFDYDDAIFVRPSWERQGVDDDLTHEGLRTKTRRLVSMASHVVASTPALADFARRSNSHVSVIPTPIDITRYRPAPNRPPNAPPVIGWMGTSGNLHYLRGLRPVLEDLARRHRFVLRVVCNDVPAVFHPRLANGVCEFRIWSMRREVEELQRFDIGLMPLDDDAWTRGKAGFKIITYLACGVPCVASPVGFNPTALGPAGACGLYASSPEQWHASLDLLLSDIEARQAMGRRGRERAVARFDVRRHAARWIEVLHEVAAA